MPHSLKLRRRVVLILLALVAVIIVMARLGMSPLAFISVSALVAPVILALQSFLQNIAIGASIDVQGRFPIGSRIAVENAAGTVTGHHLLFLGLRTDDAQDVEIPYTKFLAVLIFHNPPPIIPTPSTPIPDRSHA